jgi:L-fuculose-phosphate aldolase
MCSRDDVIATARRMAALGLVIGTFGNISCRLGKRILITPSGLDYEAMHPEDLVLLTLAGDIVEGDRVPSSERRLHVAIYARLPEVRAVVHTHSPWAVTAAETRSELPAGDSTILLGPVPVAPYQPPGTQELADQAAQLLVDRGANAVILRDHGVVGTGLDLDEALEACRDVERLAGDLR